MNRLLLSICINSFLFNVIIHGKPIFAENSIMDSRSNFVGSQSKSSTSSNQSNWEYGDQSSWNNATDNNCNGLYQSPINIDPDKTIYEQYSKLIFGNYERMWPMSITNEGHTVVVDLQENASALDELPYITGGGLEDHFNFAQLHFHWGGDAGRGSEHLIQFKRYSGELHIVHYNSRYGSFDEAAKYHDGIAVLGILLERDWAENNVLTNIVSQFGEIQQSGQKAKLSNPIFLQELLPAEVQSFYRYSGSLTTPGCQETVSWTVFETPLVVSQNHLEKFRELFDNQGQHMQDNYRPIQAENNRIITYSSDIDKVQFSQQQDPVQTDEENPSPVIITGSQDIHFPLSYT